MIMIMENMRFYVSECVEEGTTITPPATLNRLEYPRLVNSVIPHTSQIDFGTSTKARGELGLVPRRMMATHHQAPEGYTN